MEFTKKVLCVTGRLAGNGPAESLLTRLQDAHDASHTPEVMRSRLQYEVDAAGLVWPAGV